MQYDPDLPWRDVRGEGFNRQIGPIRFAPLGERRWCASVVLDSRHLNVGGVCHGGVLLSLADVAMGVATFEAGGGHPCATIQMDGHFLASAREGQRLVALATQLRKVRELSFMQCEVWAGESEGESPADRQTGRQVLRASGTWKYLAGRARDSAGTGTAP